MPAPRPTREVVCVLCVPEDPAFVRVAAPPAPPPDGTPDPHAAARATSAAHQALYERYTRSRSAEALAALPVVPGRSPRRYTLALMPPGLVRAAHKIPPDPTVACDERAEWIFARCCQGYTDPDGTRHVLPVDEHGVVTPEAVDAFGMRLGGGPDLWELSLVALQLSTRGDLPDREVEASAGEHPFGA